MTRTTAYVSNVEVAVGVGGAEPTGRCVLTATGNTLGTTPGDGV